MAKREFLQLAHTYNPKKHSINGWFISEKLDGMRGFWDGGITRGMPASAVPWANTAKDARLKVQPVATGLWSRYGHVIHAPAEWLAQLPGCPLDGELYAGRGNFQKLVSITKRMDFSGDWDNVEYKVFDMPPLATVFADGEIDVTNFKKRFSGIGGFLAEHAPMGSGHGPGIQPNMPFMSRRNYIEALVKENDVVKVHVQTRLPMKTADAEAAILNFCNDVCDNGGEGVILKSPSSLYECERCHTMLKFKPFEDAEATVIGYNWGRETDKGSKLLGLMGSMVLRTKAGTFELSGFTDAERQMNWVEPAGRRETAYEFGTKYPGAKVPDTIQNPRFPRGSTVTYKFRELTDAGLPKEARYWRKRDDA